MCQMYEGEREAIMRSETTGGKPASSGNSDAVMTIYSLEKKKPENDGAECLVWMGTWWRHVVWCEFHQRFLTGDMELLRKRVDLWFYAPEAVES